MTSLWRLEILECHVIFILQITIRYAKQTSFLVEKDVFSSCQERRTSKKFWVLMTNQTSHLRIPHSYALPLRHGDSILSKAHYEVYICHGSCILLGSAMSLASYFIYRIRKLFRFELVKEIERVKVDRRFQPKFTSALMPNPDRVMIHSRGYHCFPFIFL